MSEVDSITLQLRADIERYLRDMERARRESTDDMDDIGDESDRMGRRLERGFGAAKSAALGFIAALGVGAVIDVARAGLDYAASLGEIAQSLSVGTQFLQEFRYAATQNGASIADADAALGKFSITLGKALDGSKSDVESFTKLGISLAALNKASDSERYTMVADAIAAIDDPTRQAAAAVDIFGKGALKLLPTLQQGADGFREQAAAAREFGIILSDGQIQNADKTADKIDALNNALQAKVAGAVADNANAIGFLTNKLVDLASAALGAVDAYRRFQNVGGLTGKADVKGLLNDATGRKDLINTFKERSLRAYRDAQFRLSNAGNNPADLKAARASLDFAARQRKAAGRVQALDDRLAAQRKPTPIQRGEVTPVSGGGGSRSSGGGAAKGGSNRAESEAARNQDAYEREIASATREELRSRIDRTDILQERFDLERQLLGLQHNEIRAAILKDEKEGKLSAAQAQTLTLLNDQIDQNRNISLTKAQTLTLLEQERDGVRDELATLRDAADLATTRVERAAIEKRILEAQQQIERDTLDEAISAGKIKDAAAARANLAGRQSSQSEKGNRDAESPLQRYRREVGEVGNNINDELEKIEVSGIQKLGDGIADVITGAQSLGDVFKNVANQIISDLIRVAIQQTIVAGLTAAIGGGGGGGGGGIGGFISSIFGRASGGSVSAGQVYRVNEGNTEYFQPNVNGAIIPLGQTRASPSGGGGNSQPAVIQITVDEGAMFVPRVQTISGQVSVQIVTQAAPSIATAGANEALARANRVRL